MVHAAVLLAVLLAQEASPEVARQAARISSENPRVSMDAVSRLADLAATSRASVQTAAAKLPDDVSFYRSVLQEELRARERLGEAYPKLKRASVEVKDLTAPAIFGQIVEKYGERFDLNSRLGRAALPPAGASNVTLKLDDVPFMEAIEAVCRQAKGSVASNGVHLFFVPFQESVAACAYRNFLFQVPFATRSRKVEFGAGEARSVRYNGFLFWDSDAGVARIAGARGVEAIDGDGKPVAPITDAPPEAGRPRKEGEPVFNVVNRFFQWEIALAIPESDKIARLRGFFEVLVPAASSAFELTDLEKGQKKSDDHFELETELKRDGISLRVKPKGSIEALITAPVELVGVYGDGAELPLQVPARLSEGRLEYSFSLSTRQFGVTQALKTIKVRIVRALAARRIPFEFVDLPVK